MRARSLLAGVVTAAACVMAGAGTASAGAQPLIIGGEDADQEYSFMASLQRGDGSHFCGGSLIEPEWVLTAAHCVEGATPGGIAARIGSNDRTQGGEQAQAAEIIVHPDYGPGAGGDIALVRLAQPAQSEPVDLGSDTSPGTASRLIGWGQTCPEQDGGCGAPQILQQLDTQVVDAAECSGIDPSVELCTDNPGGDSGACYGDSGGPQLVQAGGRWELIGVTSRTGNNDPTCATGPSIYTSAPAYSSWIAEHTA